MKLHKDKKLKDLFLNFLNLVEEEIKEKYLNNHDNIVIDAGFKKYYQNIANSKEQHLTELK
jgi:hypothetical protein